MDDETESKVVTLVVPNYSNSLIVELCQMKNENLFCDMRISTEEGFVPAHKVVMCSASPYFRERLSFRETHNEDIQMEDISHYLVTCMVNFIYTGKLQVKNKHVEPLMQLLNTVQLKDVTVLQDSFIKTEDDGETDEMPADASKLSGNEIEDAANMQDSLLNIDSLIKRPRKRKPTKVVRNEVEHQTEGKNTAQKTKSKVTNESKSAKTKTVSSKTRPRKLSRPVSKSVKDSQTIQPDTTNKNSDQGTDYSVKSDFTVENTGDNCGSSREIKVEVNDSFEDDLNDSEETVELDDVKQCKDCEEVFEDQKEYVLHLKTHKKGKKVRGKRKIKRWPCSICDKKLSSLVRQACHQYSKHGIPYDSEIKLHTCTYEGCKYITASKNYLRIHLCGHGNERPHVCEFCGKGFKLKSGLINHLNIHTQMRKYECGDCGMTFNQKGGLDIHVKIHHKGQESWSELCHLCSEKFLHKAQLCWHLFDKHGIPLPEQYTVFSCELCDYKSLQKWKIDRHMDSHENNRSWVCTICGKTFATKSYLNRHIKYHGEKSYVCDFEGCNYACVDKIGLKKHRMLMHTHKNYKPFACTLCTYKTGVRGNLDKHIRTVHNLEVVTKHTVHQKMKFKGMNAGDIITKDGKLVQPASSRGVHKQKEDEANISTSDDMSKVSGKKLKNVKSIHRRKKGDNWDMIAPSGSYGNEDTSSMRRPGSDDLLASPLLYLPNQDSLNYAVGHFPVPVPVNSRMQGTSQVTSNPSGMFLNIEPLASFKYPEFCD